MRFAATVFDLDGTLLDTLDDIANAANRVLTAEGFPTHPNSDYRTLIGEGVVKLMQRALPQANQDDATLRRCVAAYEEQYERTWNVQTRPYAGIPDLLDDFVALGVRLAVLSNKPDRFTQRCVEEFLGKWPFGVVLGASERLPCKPDPAGAIEVARRLGVPPAECMFVGDSGIDMQTARTARMWPVGVLWGFRGAEELMKAGAQCLITQPKELANCLDQGL